MGSISPVSSLIGETDPTGLDLQLGRSDFLRLLMAQVNNQNPLEPMQNSEFVSQLTQFSSLEQLMLIREASERWAPPLPEGEIFFSPPPPSREGEIQDRVVLNRPGGTEGAPSPEVTLEPGGTGGAPAAD